MKFANMVYEWSCIQHMWICDAYNLQTFDASWIYNKRTSLLVEIPNLIVKLFKGHSHAFCIIQP